MADQHGSIRVEGVVSKCEKDNDGNLEISLKVDSFSSLPKLNAKENKVLINDIKNISILIYPILDDEERPELENQMKVKVGIPYSVSSLRKESFKLNGSLVNYLFIVGADKEEDRYFPLEM
jgi:hypothetical protein